MLESSQAILSFINGKQRADLDTDRLLLSAIIRELEIVGEAATAISDATKRISSLILAHTWWLIGILTIWPMANMALQRPMDYMIDRLRAGRSAVFCEFVS